MYSECVRNSSEVNRLLLGIGKIYSELNRIYSEKVSMKSGRLRLPDAPPPADTNHTNQDPHISLSFKMYHMVILSQKV